MCRHNIRNSNNINFINNNINVDSNVESFYTEPLYNLYDIIINIYN